MIQETFIGLANNIALLLVSVFVYRSILMRIGGGSVFRQVVSGVVLGALCIVLMMNPWEFSNGVLFDTRSILISLSGLFFGPVPTTVMMVMGIFFRSYQGGTGVWMGVVTITTSGLAGIFWRQLRNKSPDSFSLQEMVLFGFVVNMLPTFHLLFLPRDIAFRIFSEISAIIMVIYPIITAFIGKFLSQQYEHWETVEALKKNEALLNETQQVARVGGWEYHVDSGNAYWTDEVYRIFGVERENFDPADVSRVLLFYLPEDRSVIEEAFNRAVAEGVGYDHVLQLKNGRGESLWVRTTADVEKKNGKIVRVYGHIMDITPRVLAQKALRESEERFRRALDNIPGVVVIYDPELRIQYVNAPTLEITGMSPSDFIGKRESDIWPEEVYKPYMPALEKTLETARMQTVETSLELPETGWRHVRIICVPLKDEKGRVREILGITHDLTSEKKAEMVHRRLEEQLRQAQKMEAVGRLAGGVAHDFNNLLSIIIGYSEMLREDMDEGHPNHEMLKEIFKAAISARNITRQLLAFGRKQVLEVKIFDVNEVISSIQKMLKRIIGEDIELKIELMDSPALVKADISQLEQVLMNLVVNAKDAMPEGGTLHITTTAYNSEDEINALETEALSPGRYIRIGVSDSGTGILKGDLKNIFEPFFTTKEKDKGTGLGLATVYGIVKQHGGTINVYSEYGYGATFNVYLPRSDAGLTDDRREDTGQTEPVPSKATILVAEDDVMVRGLAIRILRDSGYDVIESTSPEDAIEKAGRFKDAVHLLLTDVIMPSMKGPELYRHVAKLVPGVKVLYMSGYPGDVITRHGVLEEGIQFIQKPFTKKALFEKVAGILSGH